MRRLPVAVLVLVSLTGCTASDPATTQWRNAQTFAEQVSDGQYRSALELASPGSDAERYLTHMLALDAAASAAGYGKAPGSDLQVDDASQTITLTTDAGASTVWGGFGYDTEGRLTSWSLGEDATPLAERLWTTPAEARTAAGGLTLVSAYRNDAGLWVTLEVTATAAAPEPDCEAGYASGQEQFEAATCFAPQVVEDAAGFPMALLFEGADLGGTLQFRSSPSGDGVDEIASLPVG